MGTLIKYGITGVLNTLVDYAAFFLLSSLFGVHYLIAQTISYACGTVNSYVMNRKWTFRRTGRATKGEMLKFLVVNGLMFGLSTAILAIFHEIIGWSALVSKGIAIVAATGAGFLANKLWVFRDSGSSVHVTEVSNHVESSPREG